jgi:hypothetical protein
VRGSDEEVLPPGADAASAMRFRGQFSELPESGLSELGAACRAAGLEGLFLAALKISRPG